MAPVEAEKGYFLSAIGYSIQALPPNAPVFKALLLQSLKKFDDEIGPHVLYYSTFKKDGYKESFATLIITNQLSDHIYVTAPEDQLTGAVLWVKLHNQHLKFAEWNLAHEFEDDFLMNRKTAILSFTIPETKNL